MSPKIRLSKILKLAIIGGVVALILGLTPVLSARGQGPIPDLNLKQAVSSLKDLSAKEVVTDEITLDGYDLFTIAAQAITSRTEGSGKTPIRERIRSIENTLNQVANSRFDPQELNVRMTTDSDSNLPVIYIGNVYLMTVTTLDAELQVQQPGQWAKQLTSVIESALKQAHRERQPSFLLNQAAIAAVTLIVTILMGWFMARLQTRRKHRRHQLESEIPSELKFSPEQTSEDFDCTTAIPLKIQLTKRQQHALLDLQVRLLQLGQVAIWVGSIFILLGLFPYTRWLQPILFTAPLRILGIILGIYVLIRVSDVLIQRFSGALVQGNFFRTEGSQRLELRVQTFIQVLKNGTVLIWIVIGVLACLSVIGVDFVPLLAGAGIIGLGISFAAQSLIKDMINGVLILFEDQYAVGDVIIVGNVGGFVENMNLRITQLRNNEGQLVTVPNSEVKVVQNLSKDWSRVDLTIKLAYGTNPDHALEIINRLAEEIYSNPEWNAKMPDKPEVLGIDEIDHSGILIRVWIKTLPLQQWAVAREFRRRLPLALGETGLKVGIPQQTFWFKNSLNLDLQQSNGVDI